MVKGNNMRTIHADIYNNSFTCFADDLIEFDGDAVEFAIMDHDTDSFDSFDCDSIAYLEH
jgi:hypothetical protein